jgi:hypothetical protein
MSSGRTPMVMGSHHIEEEQQPAAPAIPVNLSFFKNPKSAVQHASVLTLFQLSSL